MKQRGWPLWLLRDVPAFAAVMLSFWPLVIFVIASGTKAMRQEKVRNFFYAHVATLIASAESRLDHALWREAYRRLGWQARRAPINIMAPPEIDQAFTRYLAYSEAFLDMESTVRIYVEHLRQQYRVSEREIVSHGAADARIHRAAITHATFIVRISASSTQHWGRLRVSARDEGGSHSSRGPPQRIPQLARSHLSAPRV